MVKDVENMMETFQEFQGVRMLLQFLSPDYTCLLRSYENFVKAAKCVGEDDELHVGMSSSLPRCLISFKPILHFQHSSAMQPRQSPLPRRLLG